MLQITYLKNLLPNSQVSEDTYVSHGTGWQQTAAVKNNSFFPSWFWFGRFVVLHKTSFQSANLFHYAG